MENLWYIKIYSPNEFVDLNKFYFSVKREIYVGVYIAYFVLEPN